MNLVLIETSGNQAFIFATNKLRENVGASELTFQVGTQFVRYAVKAAGGSLPSDNRNPTTYPEISGQNPIEIILATSGKALLLVQNKELGQKIVHSVTLKALKEAPGLEVRGVVSRDFDFDKEGLHRLIGEVHRDFEKVRSKLPGPAARFQRLPIIAECASSGLPASVYDSLGSEPSMRSRVIMAKREVAQDGLKRIRNLVGEKYRLPYSTTEIEDLGCDWLAIVHADGNGLGQVFLKFDQVANTQSNRDYITKLRSFSLALDECTERAFCRSLDVIRLRRDRLPIVPLVLGGDDLTVVCDGRQALQFTKKFIECFEEETSKHPNVKSILSKGLSSCAGVAIVKPHFPFHAGYELAEELLKSAKKIAKKDEHGKKREHPLSTIDYHILYDASGPDLERIRRELTLDNGKTLLIGRPYIISKNQGPQNRHWDDLVKRIHAVQAQNEEGDKRLLPNSMLHELRESLYLGREVAESRLALVRQRYQPHINPLLVGNNLFWSEGEQHRTGLLDAIDTAEFWKAREEA
ncbi:MAG: hypothetical protein N2112_00535 [Gemmataceae bacterium]|jgi:hypothetical protein|nr:hypothetical protein [Gemmataceae bacterium]